MGQVMVGRQPIFDANREVFGYELLFRSTPTMDGDADAMTADVLVRAGLDFGLEDLVGSRLAFVNATRSFLTGERRIALPPGQVVIEVLESVAHDDAVLDGCRRLAAEGFQLALDDYVWAPGDERLLEMVQMVKLDVLALTPEQLVEHVRLLADFDVRLVAEKVETAAQLAECKEMGFELFQGYLLSRPEVVVGASLTSSRLTCLRLLERLCEPDVSARDLERIVESDAAMSYRMLRAAGAGASGGMRRKVSSISDGLVLLGERRLRSWATLMLLSDSGSHAPEQLTIAMTRARMSELLAAVVAPAEQNAAFTAGLVSSLDLLLGLPLEEIVGHLSLAEELVDAVVHHRGLLGDLLVDVKAWEIGEAAPPFRLATDPELLERCYVKALSWATEICEAFENAA